MFKSEDDCLPLDIVGSERREEDGTLRNPEVPDDETNGGCSLLLLELPETADELLLLLGIELECAIFGLDELEVAVTVISGPRVNDDPVDFPEVLGSIFANRLRSKDGGRLASSLPTSTEGRVIADDDLLELP